MPIYGFECPSCNHRFDRLQKLSDADPTVCPACQAKGLRRQISAPAFRLSGSGWYETDFKKDGDKKRNLAGEGDGGAKSDAGGSDGGKSDGGKADTAKTDSAAPASSKAEPAKSESKPAKSESKPATPAASGGAS